MHRLAALLWVCATPVDAQTGPGAAPAVATEAWQAPTLTIVRYDEHWQRLADPAARDDHWTEPYKYIPLGDDGAYLTTGIELRARNEAYRNNLWGGAAAPDDGYLWLRAMPYADVHIGRLRGFVQPIAAYAVGVAPAPGPVDQTRTDLLQGFVDARFGAADTGATTGTGLTLRAGRQMLSFGSERLIGTRYGPNVPLAFDGLRGIVSLPGARIDLLAVRPVNTIERGTGRPLLLIHGLGGSWRSWGTILDPLSAARKVIAVDLPGHGATPAEPDSGTFDGLVGSVERYIAKTGLAGVDVVGSSMGARIVLELARRGVVGNVVALDPGGFWRGPVQRRQKLSPTLVWQVRQSSC